MSKIAKRYHSWTAQDRWAEEKKLREPAPDLPNAVLVPIRGRMRGEMGRTRGTRQSRQTPGQAQSKRRKEAAKAAKQARFAGWIQLKSVGSELLRAQERQAAIKRQETERQAARRVYRDPWDY